MGPTSLLARALFVASWLLIHALFLVLSEPFVEKDRYDAGDIQQLIPIRLPSLFQLSWFHKLVRRFFNCELLSMPRSVCGENCVRVLSWVVSALTLAEWTLIALVLLSAFWNKLIRPAIQTIWLLLLTLAAYSCLRSCAFMLAAHLPAEIGVGVVRLLLVIDSVLLQIWNFVSGLLSWALWALDGLLSSLVWPSLEAIKEEASHPTVRSLMADVLKKVQEAASHLPDGTHADL
ncbi:hypothetical protein Efla_000275 [Eimeria flavescens]